MSRDGDHIHRLTSSSGEEEQKNTASILGVARTPRSQINESKSGTNSPSNVQQISPPETSQQSSVYTADTIQLDSSGEGTPTAQTRESNSIINPLNEQALVSDIQKISPPEFSHKNSVFRKNPPNTALSPPRKGLGSTKRTSSDEGTVNLEKALYLMHPRKAKRMFDRRKRARENGEDDMAGLWNRLSSGKGKSHSVKQVQRLSNELEQVLGVLCDGDQSVAADVIAHLMKRSHFGDLFSNVKKKMSNSPERSLDTRIVDGLIGFFQHHHTRGTRPTEAARAVDAVMVACCWDICESDERPSSPSKTSALPLKRKAQPNAEKRVSNSALIERLGVNRSTLSRAREKAKVIKTEGKSHYKPEDRKFRKDKGVPAKLYREVKKVDEKTGSPREQNEYAAIDVLTNLDLVTDKEPRNISSPDHHGIKPNPNLPPFPYQPYRQSHMYPNSHSVYQQPSTESFLNFPRQTLPGRSDLFQQYGYGRHQYAGNNPMQISPLGPNPQGNMHLMQTPTVGANNSRTRQNAPTPDLMNMIQMQTPLMGGAYDNRNRLTPPEMHQSNLNPMYPHSIRGQFSPETSPFIGHAQKSATGTIDSGQNHPMHDNSSGSLGPTFGVPGSRAQQHPSNDPNPGNMMDVHDNRTYDAPPNIQGHMNRVMRASDSRPRHESHDTTYEPSEKNEYPAEQNDP